MVQSLRSNPHHLGHKVMGALGKGRLLPASAARLRILISSQLIGKLATERPFQTYREMAERCRKLAAVRPLRIQTETRLALPRAVERR